MTHFRMTMCPNADQDTIHGEFDSLEEGEAWVRENHPGFLERVSRLWESADRGPEGPKQYGINYTWVCFEPLAGTRPTSDTLVPKGSQEAAPD